jgi:hypothetical protein
MLYQVFISPQVKNKPWIPWVYTCSWHCREHLVWSQSLENTVLILTLIRAAGSVYDFRNFEEVYLYNGLSSELQNSCIPQKMSREYILLSTLEQKTAFLAI